MQVIPIYYLYGVHSFQCALSKIFCLFNNLKQQISNRNNTLGSRGYFFLIDTDGLPRQQVYFILGIY